uniref:EOG090X0ARU n=1 Tax=Scapholeberis mucronata TaxID=202097 RepID=A0A4Y7NNL5_9CRUS|nr:EOG090X0ARU [Scapholeberis mucronata]SVE93795.1 EOG090X0ARU [Scapholeberis mucronata]
MFKRKLQALGFPSPETLNTADENQFRTTVVWLEDQKIRRYKIEDREPLRATNVEEWNLGFLQYLKDLDYPYTAQSRPEILDWLLGIAIQLEFNENPQSYSSSTPKVHQQSSIKTNPLDNLDFESEDFKAGVNQLANLLQVVQHPDHLVTLQGICCLIEEKFNHESIQVASKQVEPGNKVEFNKISFGMQIKAPNLSQAANILRYLFINDLRDLQTKINECLVSVQTLTANPKTDTKLGKVGF